MKASRLNFRRIASLLIGLFLVLPLGARGADPVAAFTPEPPEEAAAQMLETYLHLLARAAYEDALTLNDLRGMRQYLLDRRLDDLKARNPEFTAQDLEDMSAQIQLGELHPERLRLILLDMLKDSQTQGMTWQTLGYAPIPGDLEGYLARVMATTLEGRDKPMLVGLIKLGDQWMISPALVEQAVSRAPVIHAAPGQPPPPDVAALAHAYWRHFQTGSLNEAYDVMSPAFRSRVSMLLFLEQARDFLNKVGIPSSWTIVQGVATDPEHWFVGVNVQGPVSARPTLMHVVRSGNTWILDDIQFTPPRPPPPGAGIPPPAATPFAPAGLRPDLSPAATPGLRPPDQAPLEPPPPPPRPVLLGPDAPIGPDQP